MRLPPLFLAREWSEGLVSHRLQAPRRRPQTHLTRQITIVHHFFSKANDIDERIAVRVDADERRMEPVTHTAHSTDIALLDRRVERP